MAKIPPATPGAVPPSGAAFAVRTSSTSGPQAYDAGGILRRAALDGVLDTVLEELGYLPGGGGGVVTPPTPTGLPQPSLSPSAATRIVGTITPGELLAQIGYSFALPGDAVVDLLPADGRLQLANNSTRIVGGSTVSAEGEQVYTVRVSRGTDTPKTATFTLTVVEEQETPEPFTSRYRSTDYERPAIGSTPGVTYAPQVPQPSATGDLQGFAFDAKDRAQVARYDYLGMVFEQGLLQPSQAVEVFRGGTAFPAQLIVRRLWPDGSVRRAIVATLFPAMTQGQNVTAMLRKASAPPAGSEVTHAALASAPITGSWAIKAHRVRDTTTNVTLAATIDVGAAALAAAGPVANDFFARGPLVTERRYRLDGPEALQMVVDVRVWANGQVDLDYQPSADVVIFSNPSDYTSWVYDLTLAQGGTSVLAVTNKVQHLATVGRKQISTALPAASNALNDPPAHNIQVDAQRWVQLGAFLSYGFDLGVSAAALAKGTERTSDAGWRQLLGTNAVSQGMSGPGARDDIGAHPGWVATWLLSQDAVMRRNVLGAGDTAGAVPWNYWDPNKGVQLNSHPTFGYPGLHYDGRADRVPGTENLNIVNSGLGWEVDFGHHPQLAYAPLLMTGARFYEDRVSQSCIQPFIAISVQNRQKAGNDYLVFSDNQVREAGWFARDVGDALWALPDDWFLRGYVQDAMTFNFQWLNARAIEWQAIQGEPYGWLAWANPYDQPHLKAWMQDHWVVGQARLYMAGVPGVGEFMAWGRNFHVGRKLQTALPYRKANAAVFLIQSTNEIHLYPPSETTWAGYAKDGVLDWFTGNLYAGSYDANGWKIGAEQRHGLRTDGIYASLFKDPDAAATITRFVSEGCAEAQPAGLRDDPLEYIRPLAWKAGVAPPVFVPPSSPLAVPKAGQNFTAARSVTAGTKVMEVESTGGPPSGGTVREVGGGVSAAFGIVNGNDLVALINLSAETLGQRQLTVELSNSGGTSARVAVGCTIVAAAQPATSIFATTGTGYRQPYSMNRKMVGNYTGPAFWARRGDGMHQDIGFLGNGSVDLATLSTFANGGPVTAEIWYAQDGSGSHLVQSDPTKQFVVTNTSGVLTLESGTDAGRWMRTGTVAVNNANLGAIAAVRVDDFRFNGRILSVLAPGSEDSDSLPGVASMLMWEGSKVSYRVNDGGDGAQELRTSDSTNSPSKMVVGAAYRAGQPALGIIDGFTGTGEYVWSTLFADVQFRVGFPDVGEHNQMIGGIYELQLVGVTTPADLGIIRANMKAKYGSP